MQHPTNRLSELKPRLSRTEAIARFSQENSELETRGRAFHFANINRKKEVWWYDIPLRLISSNANEYIELLAYDNRSDELHHLSVPVKCINSYLPGLAVSIKKQAVCLELSADPINMFEDIRPGGRHIDFAVFKTTKPDYIHLPRALAELLRMRRLRAILAHEGSSSLHDPIEDDPRLKEIINDVENEVDCKLQSSGVKQDMGYCFLVWHEMEKILRERFGVVWFSPSKMNPSALYD
jgi:hypothetical protein